MPVIQITDGRSALWQWDTGVKIRILGCCSVQQCHFPTAAGLIARDAVDNVCAVPDAALQTAGTLKVYAYSRNEDGGVTMNEFSLPVTARPKPADYIDPPDEMDSLDQIVQRVVDRIGDISGGIVEEKDPTVPSWAKQPDPPAAPVQSVNGKTGAVQINASDVGALPVDAIKASASGAVVSVTDAAARPAVGLVSQIVAVQEGEGSPSPDNIRPIVGWDKVGVTRTGRNLLPFKSNRLILGVPYEQMGRQYVANPDGSVTITTQDATTTSGSVNWFRGAIPLEAGKKYYGNSEGAALNYRLADGRYFSSKDSYTAQEGDVVVEAWFWYGAGVEINATFVPMLTTEKDAKPEPYTGQTLTADLPETVYGGNWAWVTGVLTVTHNADGEKLSQPYTIQLTPQQLDMLKGANNVWSDTGNTDLVYVADLQMYIDQRIAAIASAVVGQ